MSHDERRFSLAVAPDREIRVCVRGEGPELFLLHGFTGSIDSVSDLAGRLGRGRRVIRVDLPGHGRTRVPADPTACSMEACVSDLEAVADALGASRCDVAGYSMGARAALAWGVWHPERVCSLALLGARAGMADAADRARRIAADERLADQIEEQGLEWFVDHWMALPLFASQRRLGAEALARERRARLGADPRGLSLSLRGMGAGAQPSLHDRLRSVRAPVLLLVGEEDERFQAEARNLAARLPHARVAIVARAGHAAHLEKPEATGRAIRGFLESLDGSPAPHAQAARPQGAGAGR